MHRQCPLAPCQPATSTGCWTCLTQRCDACLWRLRLSDPEVAADVEALLAEHRLLSAEGFLDSGSRSVPARRRHDGGYTLVSPIGHGGMGSVWLAARSDGRFEGHAAIKLLNAALVGRAGKNASGAKARSSRASTHPHIARLIDAGVSAPGSRIWCSSTSTAANRSLLRRGAARHEDRMRLFLDVLAAVAHAHANLIVHRDLKPSNVLVDARQVKLLDFGIAKLLEGRRTRCRC